jgi:hypothetical protein
MDYIHGKTIKELKLTGTDRSRQIDVVARDDGTFQFYERIAISEEEGGGWTPGKVSGFYQSAEAAELAARVEFSN